MSKQELLPCPHCNGKAKMCEGMGEKWVRCIANCTSGVSSEDSAVKLWNIRHSPWNTNMDEAPKDGTPFVSFYEGEE